MTKSESIKAISKALISFHQKISKISKDSNNPFFKSKYASLSNILEAINGPLNESGLSLSQFPTGTNGLTTILMHESGEWIQGEYEMKPVKDDPQGRGSCITYQRRYALAAILSLNIDEDDDGNKASQPSPAKASESPENASDERKWLNKGTKEYLAVQHRLVSGTLTMEELAKHYKLNKEIYKELSSITPMP
jgi:hypothetical protein